MAKINDSLLEGISGKVGKIVISHTNGKDIVRHRPRKSRAKISEAQKMHRIRFKTNAKFLRTIVPYIRYGYVESGSYAYSKACSNNIKACSIDTAGTASINYADIKVANGSMAPLYAQTTVSGTTATFTWDKKAYEGISEDTDVIMPMVYNTSKGLGIYHVSKFVRTDGSASISFPDSWKGDSLALYIAARNADATISSDSTYLGQVTA